jgi:hypothetical protein
MSDTSDNLGQHPLILGHDCIRYNCLERLSMSGRREMIEPYQHRRHIVNSTFSIAQLRHTTQ